MNYLIASNKQRAGLNSFSAGSLDDMLILASIYFSLPTLYESADIDKVMIRYT